MRAFIIRPFGIKNDINFDEVERLLIAPALKRVGAEGGTTIDIVEAGNIRVDMFRRLLTADLVVADLAIHNANVFYELGIRHALRDRSTLMMRCEADAFPFDLQTDRYFVYKEKTLAQVWRALSSLYSGQLIPRTRTAPSSYHFPNLASRNLRSLWLCLLISVRRLSGQSPTTGPVTWLLFQMRCGDSSGR